MCFNIFIQKIPKHETGVPRGTFSATLSIDLIGLDRNQAITFDTEVTNPQMNYDPSTGAFTCPVGGTYVFHFTVQSVGSGRQIDLGKV